MVKMFLQVHPFAIIHITPSLYRNSSFTEKKLLPITPLGSFHRFFSKTGIFFIALKKHPLRCNHFTKFFITFFSFFRCFICQNIFLFIKIKIIPFWITHKVWFINCHSITFQSISLKCHVLQQNILKDSVQSQHQ